MKNESVSLNLKKPENWVISRIIKNKCKVNRNFQIIEFIDKEIWTYDDLFSLGLKAAHILNDLNLKKNDPVLVMINDPKKFIPIWVGSSFLGLKFVAINTALRGSVLLHQITMSSAKVILLEDEYYDEVLKKNFDKKITKLIKLSDFILSKKLNEKLIQQSKNSDVSCIMFTSGTSGPSKGVIMPNGHCVLFAIGTIENYRLKEKDVFTSACHYFTQTVYLCNY